MRSTPRASLTHPAPAWPRDALADAVALTAASRANPATTLPASSASAGASVLPEVAAVEGALAEMERMRGALRMVREEAVAREQELTEQASEAGMCCGMHVGSRFWRIRG